MRALEEATRILSYDPPAHLHGPAWRALVEQLVLELVETRVTVQRLEQHIEDGRLEQRADAERRAYQSEHERG